MKKNTPLLLIQLLQVLLFYACNSSPDKKTGNISFTELPSSQTGIRFINTITENDTVNLITNEYLYIGGGVGIGDFNNDNLPDVFFSGNQVSSRLYLNKGNFSFEDITEKAGVVSSFWGAGVSIVDLNADGYDDIYLCASGSKDPLLRRNHLYINNKDLSFTEQAAAYGLADTGFSTQAAFFDYDKDGDLDMYLLNHLLYNLSPNTIQQPGYTGHLPAADKLYRNEGIQNDASHPVFKDISAEAGIKERGYGLGVVVSDFNDDNWPDVYVANDYLANDLLWLNNRRASFTNGIATAIKHQSYSSMGVDAADFNNDGTPDLASLDMMPEDNERQKMMYSFMNFERYEMERRMGHQPSFMRNMLQMNNGVRMVNDTMEPFFSEIGQLAGIHETDWSWSVLMADLDNDGWKDIHITNGMGRDMLNNDFVIFKANNAGQEFSSQPERVKNVVEKLNHYGTVELKNYCYRNNGDLTFTDVSNEAGLTTPSVSNGCAYADLDNDGDLDLVVNNINKEAFILRNDLSNKDSLHNHITIQLRGDSLNKKGIAAKVKLYCGPIVQLVEQYPVRGYASSVDQRLHIGIGRATIIDSIIITWPNDQQEILKNVRANNTITILQKEAVHALHPGSFHKPLFIDITSTLGIEFKHRETFFHDYSFQRLLPQKYSQLGPHVTTGDVNGDGLSDFYVGGAYNQSGRFFLQQIDGKFNEKYLTTDSTKDEEDLGCLLFDADGDKDLDLFVNSGGYEYDAGSSFYIPRLYKNDGKGNFSLDIVAIPRSIVTSAHSVSGADYDGDSDIDLFIGGRISPNQYPVPPRSYLLQNNNGQFSDVTRKVCPSLQEIGMVTAAIWTDFNNDNKLDLIVTGEWMDVRFFANRNGLLHDVTPATGLKNMHGLWRSLCAADIDKDGDMDLLAGNQGLNNRYKMLPGESIKLFAKDLDNNGSIDPILSYYIKDQKGERQLFPAPGRDRFAEQVPSIRKKYPYHADYSTKKITDLISNKDREGMLEFVCEETQSGWFENKGNGKFFFHTLPIAAQFAPINAIACLDVNGDSHTDIIVAGNEYQAEPSIGRYDASYGLVLQGNGKGNFMPLAPAKTGLIVEGDVKDLKFFTTGRKERIIIFAVNDEKLKIYKLP